MGVIQDNEDEIDGERDVWACRHLDKGILYSLDELEEDFFEQHEIVSGVTRLSITYTDDGPIFELMEKEDDHVKDTFPPSTQPSPAPTQTTEPSSSPSIVPTFAESNSPTRLSDATFSFSDGGGPSPKLTPSPTSTTISQTPSPTTTTTSQTPSPTTTTTIQTPSPTITSRQTQNPTIEVLTDDLFLDDDEFVLFPNNSSMNETDDAIDFDSPMDNNDSDTSNPVDDLLSTFEPSTTPISDFIGNETDDFPFFDDAIRDALESADYGGEQLDDEDSNVIPDGLSGTKLPMSATGIIL